MDISNITDQKILRDSASGMPKLLSLIEEELDLYLTIFPEQWWRKIYSGGMLVIGEHSKHQQGYDIQIMLETTKSLRILEKYSGFEKLILGFRNPSQVTATMFEVEVAAWCATRKITKSIEFSPEVKVNGHTKHPEFLWNTEIGSLYVECKSGISIENKSNKLASRLSKALDEAYKINGPWSQDYCLDLSINRPVTNQTEERIRDVVSRASEALRLGITHNSFENKEVKAMLRKREELPPFEPETIRTSMIKVGTAPTLISPENAHTTFAMSVSRSRTHATRKLINEAKTQLPKGYPSAIFIRLGGSLSAQKKVEQLLILSEYVDIPWIGICSPTGLKAVWRNEQPFDERLLL